MVSSGQSSNLNLFACGVSSVVIASLMKRAKACGKLLIVSSRPIVCLQTKLSAWRSVGLKIRVAFPISCRFCKP